MSTLPNTPSPIQKVFIDLHLFDAVSGLRSQTASICSRVAPFYGECASLNRSKTGRPSWAGSSNDFNISHSGGIALIAVSRKTIVGIDVESRSRGHGILNFQSLARDHFADSELEIFASAKGQSREDIFFHVWTQKEACLKAIGIGLRFDLKKIEVEANPARGCRILHVEGHHADDFYARRVDVAPDFAVCVVEMGRLVEPTPIRWMDWRL